MKEEIRAAQVCLAVRIILLSLVGSFVMSCESILVQSCNSLNITGVEIIMCKKLYELTLEMLNPKSTSFVSSLYFQQVKKEIQNERQLFGIISCRVCVISVKQSMLWQC